MGLLITRLWYRMPMFLNKKEMKYSFLAIDLQNDFVSKGGKNYSEKQSVAFLKKVLFPFIKKYGMTVSEIVADYRHPRPGKRKESCVPGEWGYESIVPSKIVRSKWVKGMNSPVWVRKNIGIADAKPGLPFSDPRKFLKWVKLNIGLPDKVRPILIGETIDCCVLAAAQELSWNGYAPMVLREAVDHASGKVRDRDKVLALVIKNWAEVIEWKDLKRLLNANNGK